MKRVAKETINKKIHKLIEDYMVLSELENQFTPGKSLIRYAGAVYNKKELNAMVDIMLTGWFGLGTEGELLEKELAAYLGAKAAFLTNSGSSADLLAVASLMSYQFSQHLEPGDEVITPACTFPAVVAALVHHRLKPVFVDVDIETLNPRAEDIEKAITKKTKMIFLVHTLGNPNDMTPIMRIAKEHNLLVLEDNCDAFGSTYDGKKTGSFGIMSAESFYPAHHMTTAGEGGAVFINDLRLKRIVQSLREWGRACWCGASGGGTNGVCGVRFKYKIDDIPYDHKYIFSHIGYNLKPIELQAAMGRVQLKKVERFIEARKRNFAKYYAFFQKYSDFFILLKALPCADPSWFAFPLTIKAGAPFDRLQITKYLEDNMIQTRPIFAGNILRQPGFKDIDYKVSGELTNSNMTFTNTFFIGVYPGLTNTMISYTMEIFQQFLKKY